MSKTGTWLAFLLALAFFLLYFADVASGIDEKLVLKVIAFKVLIYFVWLCFSIFILLSYFEKRSIKQVENKDKPHDNLKGYEGWMAEEDQYHDPLSEDKNSDEDEEEFQQPQ